MTLLFLNNISSGELLLIAFFALIFFGSKRLPGVARSMGRVMRQMRDATDEIQRDIRDNASQLKDDLKIDQQIKDDLDITKHIKD